MLPPRVRSAIHRASLVSPLILVVQACAGASHPVVVPSSERPCALPSVPSVAPDSISVGVLSPVDAAQAPVPRNAGERFVFAQLYETLIDVDCEGRPYPGLASSWTLDGTRRAVTLVLRAGARFWDGQPMTARDVVAAWRATADARTDDWRWYAGRLADGATIVDDRRLIVSLPDSEVRLLAHPALAIYRRPPDSPWPQGSGPYRLADAAPGTLVLEPVAPHSPPRITVRSRLGADARDLIDAGMDVLPVADAPAVTYAASRSDITVVPLPWSSTFALVVPGVVDTARGLSSGADSLAALRASLARDAVRGDARAADPPLRWPRLDQCGSAGSGDRAPRVAARSTRIVYLRDDLVARGIAERLVALAGSRNGAGASTAIAALAPALTAAGGRATSAGLTPRDFHAALEGGVELAYVTDLPRQSFAPCADFAARFPALVRPLVPSGAAAPAFDVTPLIDTRGHAILRRGRVSAVVDWDGTLRLTVSRTGGEATR